MDTPPHQSSSRPPSPTPTATARPDTVGPSEGEPSGSKHNHPGLTFPGFDLIKKAPKLPGKDEPKKFSIADGLLQVQTQLETGFKDHTGFLSDEEGEDDDDDGSDDNASGNVSGSEHEDDVTELPTFRPEQRRHSRIPQFSNLLKVDTVRSSMESTDRQPVSAAPPSSPRHNVWTLSPSKKHSKKIKFSGKYTKQQANPLPSRGLGATAMHSDLMLRNPMLVRPSTTTTKTTQTTTMVNAALPSDLSKQQAVHNISLHLNPTNTTLATVAQPTMSSAVAVTNTVNPHQHAEVLIENQRGWFLLGFPFFSANMLFPSDPSPWTCGPSGFTPAPGDILSFPLPTPAWEWSWRRWYVDMAYDVDDQGWSYSWNFSSKSWHGSHVWFHSFVRRRRWIRVRERKRAAPKSAVAARYGPKYFALPPAGRIESSLAGSSVRNSVDSTATGTPILLALPGQQSRPSSVYSTTAPSMRRPSQFSDRASVASFMAEPRDFAALVGDLKAARLDRERLDLFTAFVASAGVDPGAVPSPRQDAALAELRALASDPQHMRAVLHTFTFLDSKRHLVSHLRGVLDRFSGGPVHPHTHDEDEEDVPPPTVEDASAKKPATAVAVAAPAGSPHEVFVRAVESIIAVCTDVVRQQQYYTDST